MARFLITGVNRGIGAALTREAVSRGHQVIGTTRSGADGDLAVDMSDPSAIAAALSGLDGPVDVLINNAGVIGPARQSTLEMDWQGFADTLTINTLAPLAVAQAALPHLRKGTTPRIVSISSQMSYMGYATSDRIAYRASKSALNKVMQGLATDLREEGVTVALVDPGWVRTDMGGPEADLDVDVVASGIIALSERLTLQDTGKFFRYSGEERPF